MARNWVEVCRVSLPALRKFIKAHKPNTAGTLPALDIMGKPLTWKVEVSIGHANVSFHLSELRNNGRMIRLSVVCTKEDGMPFHVPLMMFVTLVHTQPEIIEEYAGHLWRGTHLLFERDNSEKSA